EELYTPIVVGPMAQLGRYHAGGEAEAIRGAEASFTLTVLSSRSSLPIGEIASVASGPFWFNVYAVQADAIERARGAVSAGASAIWVTAGVTSAAAASPGTGALAVPIDWEAVERV